MKTHLLKTKPCGYVAVDPEFKKMHDIYVLGIKEPVVIKCEKCMKIFKCRNSLYRHKHSCTGVVVCDDAYLKLINGLTTRMEAMELKMKSLDNTNEHEERLKTKMNDVYEYLCNVHENAFEKALNQMFEARKAQQARLL